MRYIVEDEEMGPYIASTEGDGVECNLEYVRLKSTGNGYELYIHGELRCEINYAEMVYLRAALTILESEYQHLGYTDIYTLGDKI